METIEKPQIELLAPAGNLEKLKIAVLYGADAVYIGGQKFGLRSKAGNFTMEEIAKGVRFAHDHGAKVYVATNIIAHNDDLSGLAEYGKELVACGVDAAIVADPAILTTFRQEVPELEIHLSTQSSTTNAHAVTFWAKEGVTRVVLAREVTMDDITAIHRDVKVELETFIHGAMCSSYSGRCVLSNHMTNRDANRGGCAQSCRWNYQLYADEDESEGLAMMALQSGQDEFTMGSKDLCMIEQIPELLQAGVYSLKIEGRMKTIHYIATVVGTYRKAIDAYLAAPDQYVFQPAWYDELMKVTTRDFSTGFYYGNTNNASQVYGSTSTVSEVDFAGVVLDYDEQTQLALIEQRNAFRIGQEIEWIGPHRELFSQTISAIYSEDKTGLTQSNVPLQKVWVKTDVPVRPYDLMRTKKAAMITVSTAI